MTTPPFLRACALACLLHAGLVHSAHSAPDAGTDEPPPPGLGAALEAAWQRSLALPLTEGLRLRAAAEQGIADRPWAAAPGLELSQRSDRWSRDRGAGETELALGLPLWGIGQRDAQRAVAAGLFELAEVERVAARLQLAGQLREQAWRLGQLRAAWHQAEAQAQGLQKLAADVARRVSAGDLAETDALAARAEALAAAAQARLSLQALQQEQQQWRLLTGLEAPPGAPEVAAVAAAVAAAESAPPPHPLLRRAEARLEQARRQLELERRSGRDAPELRLGWRQDRAARGAEREGSVLIGLRVPLEAERRNGVKLAEATAALHGAELELARLREQLQAEQAMAREALQTAQALAGSSAEQARLLRERAALLQRSFDGGETALPELLRALSAAGQAEAGLHQSQAALGLAQARVNQSLGLLP